MTPTQRRDALASVEELSDRGLRVIAFARRRLDELPVGRGDLETGLEYVGLVAFQDPVREGVPESALS